MNDENMPLSEYVKSRFDHINTQLDTLTREVRAVHRQATKTNGRVNQLETKAEVAKAVVGGSTSPSVPHRSCLAGSLAI
jgi:uncharacterized protein YhaN